MQAINSLDRGWGRWALFAVIAAMILYTSFNQPFGLGIIIAFAVLVLVNLLRKGGLAGLGLSKPQDIKATILWAAVWGFAFQCFNVMFLTPGIEWIVGQETDYGIFQQVEGNFMLLMQWLAFIWLAVAVIEEVVFRRYIFEELNSLLGGKGDLPFVVMIVATVFFGMSHMYQGLAGVLSTAVVGAFLMVLYLKSGRNLWMPIIAHGVINTIGFLFFYFGMFHVDDLVWGLAHLAER